VHELFTNGDSSGLSLLGRIDFSQDWLMFFSFNSRGHGKNFDSIPAGAPIFATPLDKIPATRHPAGNGL
jgi:hypothetical protein